MLKEIYLLDITNKRFLFIIILLFYIFIFLNINILNLLNILVLIFMCCSFFSNSFLIFFIFRELTLIPLTFSIFFFGLYPERLNAMIYIIFYTLILTLPLFVC